MISRHSDSTLPFPEFASSVPAADRAVLAGLSRDDIRALTLRKSKEYRLLSYAMLSIHNAAAPINTLPTELLIRILGQTWQDRRSVRLTSVCRRWHSIYLSAPQFWATAVSNLSFNYAKTVMVRAKDISEVTLPFEDVAVLLERSSPCLIHLDVDQHSTNVAIPVSVLPVELSVHAWRISSLSLFGTSKLLPDLPRLLERSIPALETLRIVIEDEDEKLEHLELTTLPRLPAHSLPHLRQAQVTPGVLFPHFAVKSLRDVSLHGFFVPLHLSLEARDLLQALRVCPHLETLHLSEGTTPQEWPTPDQAGVVHLPSLKKLEIDDEPGDAVIGALNALSVPPTALIVIGAIETTNLPDFLPRHLFQRHPFDHVYLRVNGNKSCRSKCFTNNSRQLWDLDFNYTGPLVDLGLPDYFQAVHVTHLEVSDAWDNGPWNARRNGVDDWVAALQAFPHLIDLSVCGSDGPNLVLPALVGCTASPSSTHLPCAALTSISLGWKITAPDDHRDRPTNLPRGCDTAMYRLWDVEERIRRRCSAMQSMLEQRASRGAPKLHALEFWEFETRRWGLWRDDYSVRDGWELIPASRRDDTSSACLARLRSLVGGPVVYRGYLLEK
ncbi:hypothetical protein DICSQDRAFT_181240 [Dichomitus squalens LYAD-421 SS1]|uniref:F-box domain-containing protein n=1 Tax=Dichomitus squalens (strain LYAD-421) TaxID=732165 RepID=R7SX24_DICSQ|nr:uncharacterized protein DICSQDRAFT_181240 [Dichomitus squalens LYAD-421 SS1]EJF60518.1 hypothetical protein DICSQDRAFT_181240 [Dichomitus squalens LYAD-421 SS1]